MAVLDLIMQRAPVGTTPQTLGLPDPSASQLVHSRHGMGHAESERRARLIADRHRKARGARHQRDLTAEKYLVHLDGEGSSQWADIVNGQYVMIPPSLVDSLRLQRNLLRPLTENMVSYHTGQEFRAVAISAQDKKSRDRARIDTLFANNLIVTQRLNELFAEALYMAACYGFCPVHAQWRDDAYSDLHEPVYSQTGMYPGFIDCWVGDPWDTVFNEGATKRSVRWMSYGRVLPADLVRQAFEHIPGIEKLVGSTRLPSASRFQRTIRRWSTGAFAHSTAAIMGGGADGEELVALVCREEAPGFDPDYPEGRLEVVALGGQSETDSRQAGGSTIGSAMYLHNGPLPGRRFNAVRVYGGRRTDDVLGAPYLKDLDDLQVQLNHLVTLRTEFLTRYARPPLVARAGSMREDTVTTADDAIIEYSSEQAPQFLYPPQGATQLYDAAIQETLDQMFRIGGWQAASRGESNAGDPAAKVVALARADDTVFGPMNRDFQGSVCEFLQIAHCLAKSYMTAPMLVELAGEEWGHIADPWIRQEQMSPYPPSYRLVSGFGATPEARGQQLTQLVGMKGADGQPLLSTRHFWMLWPDHSLRPPETDALRVREARAQAVNYAIEKAVEMAAEQYGPQLEDPMLMQQVAHQIHVAIGREFLLERTDDPQHHVEVLDQLVQNVYAHPAARLVARWRQGLYFDFMNMIAQQQAQAAAATDPKMVSARAGADAKSGRTASSSSPKALPSASNQFGGTPGSNAMSPETLQPTVQGLTNQARGQGAGYV